MRPPRRGARRAGRTHAGRVHAARGAATPARRRGRTALLVIGHGSRVGAANRLLRRIAAALGRRFPGAVVEACYLEAATPGIQAGVDRCVARGARRIVFVPYFLYLGGHVLRDLPRAMREARRRHAGLRLARAAHLGYDDRLVAVAAGRAAGALRRRRWA